MNNVSRSTATASVKLAVNRAITGTSPDDTPDINFYFPEPQVYLPLVLRDAP